MKEIIDEFAGQGGSYVLDAKTGKRVLRERTQDANEQTNQPITTDAPIAAQEQTK